MRQVVTILLLSLGMLLLANSLVHAQVIPYGVALNLEVADQQIQDGDIVEESSEGIVRTEKQGSQKMIGVSISNPIIVVHEKTDKTRGIASTGEAMVRVSAKNGSINKGDFITSSDIPGVGVKAREAGYVLGVAKTSFGPANATVPGASNDTGMVLVAINIHYAASAPTDLGNPVLRIIKSFTLALEDQSKVSTIIRYFVAALLALMVFILSIFLFGRTIRSGMEAIGRNPLARSGIQFGMMINFIITIVLTMAGIIVAFIIARI